MVRKGRSCLGEKNGAAKLSDADIYAILALQGIKSRQEVAEQFRISTPHVGRIWKHQTRVHLRHS